MPYLLFLKKQHNLLQIIGGALWVNGVVAMIHMWSMKKICHDNTVHANLYIFNKYKSQCKQTESMTANDNSKTLFKQSLSILINIG